MGISRVDLQVPFAEKDDAKRLGARWDGLQRIWYVPEGADPTPFKKWLPEAQAPNIRAPRCQLVIARAGAGVAGRAHVFAIRRSSAIPAASRGFPPRATPRHTGVYLVTANIPRTCGETPECGTISGVTRR